LTYLVQSPRFFAAAIFGWTFVLVGNSAANGISFGVHILQALGKDASQGRVQAIAMAAAALLGVIHGLGRKFGIYLNNLFALAKVLILCMIIILGFIVLHNSVIPREPLSYANLDVHTCFQHVESGPRGTRGFASAYLNIIFTFSGWSQANYVSRIMWSLWCWLKVCVARFSAKLQLQTARLSG
jgi:L-asparagine transporter-like permease